MVVRSVFHRKTDLTPSVAAVFIVSTKIDTYQKHRGTVEGASAGAGPQALPLPLFPTSAQDVPEPLPVVLVRPPIGHLPWVIARTEPLIQSAA